VAIAAMAIAANSTKFNLVMAILSMEGKSHYER
jgi:hypothetical protein